MVRHVAVPALLRVELLRAQRTIKGQLKVGSLMNGRSVRRQLFRLLEAQPTLDTLYRRVLDPPMAPQMRLIHHLLVTVGTLIAQDLGVLQLVLVQRVGEAGAQRAMRALVLIPLVHRHVALQLELGGDASAALLARDRVLARVRAHVVLEQLGPIERTVAVGTLEDRVLALLAIDLILLHGHVLVRVPFPRLLELPLGPLVGVAWLATTLSGGGTLMDERERANWNGGCARRVERICLPEYCPGNHRYSLPPRTNGRLYCEPHRYYYRGHYRLSSHCRCAFPA